MYYCRGSGGTAAEPNSRCTIQLLLTSLVILQKNNLHLISAWTGDVVQLLPVKELTLISAENALAPTIVCTWVETLPGETIGSRRSWVSGAVCPRIQNARAGATRAAVASKAILANILSGGKIAQ